MCIIFKIYYRKTFKTIIQNDLLTLGTAVFQGDIQELKFYPTPDTAYELCLVSTIDGCKDEGKNKLGAATSVTTVEEVGETEDDFESFTTKSDHNSLDLTSVVRN